MKKQNRYPIKIDGRDVAIAGVLKRVLGADEILDIIVIKPRVYYVRYRKCKGNDGNKFCWKEAVRVTFRGKYAYVSGSDEGVPLSDAEILIVNAFDFVARFLKTE